MVGEGVLVPFDPSVGGFDVSSFERRFSNDQSVDDDSEGPNVDLVGMTGPALQDFGCNVVGSATNGSFLLSVKIELGSEPEVSEFDLHLFV